jgi:hypothetical protein
LIVERVSAMMSSALERWKMRRTQYVSRLVVAALIIAATGFLAGAAHGEESKKEQSGVTGVWQGQTSATCAMTPDRTRCGAVNYITFTLFQHGSEVTGSYKCAYGNLNCRNMNDTGRVVNGKMGQTLLTMLVMLPDGSSCRFSGQPKADNIQGGYTCTQGGARVEQGLWKAQRSY